MRRRGVVAQASNLAPPDKPRERGSERPPDWLRRRHSSRLSPLGQWAAVAADKASSRRQAGGREGVIHTSFAMRKPRRTEKGKRES